MLPAAYGLPVAIALVFGGALACFAGYRLFRIVLGIYGFILGAMLASSMAGVASNIGMLVSALIGGLVGSIVLVMAYFVGVALIGAGMGALIGTTLWAQFGTGEAPTIVIAVVSAAGAVGAMLVQRYVTVVGTALAGAWTMIVGMANALATRGITRGASATDVWILYPTSVPGAERWIPFAWIGLSILGIAVQLATTGNKKKRK